MSFSAETAWADVGMVESNHTSAAGVAGRAVAIFVWVDDPAYAIRAGLNPYLTSEVVVG